MNILVEGTVALTLCHNPSEIGAASGDARGRGARCAVGMAELPIGIAVEIEAVVQVR